MLIMGKVAVTVKAVCALASGKPIITIDYLEKWIDSVEKKTPKPNVDRFVQLLNNRAC